MLVMTIKNVYTLHLNGALDFQKGADSFDTINALERLTKYNESEQLSKTPFSLVIFEFVGGVRVFSKDKDSFNPRFAVIYEGESIHVVDSVNTHFLSNEDGEVVITTVKNSLLESYSNIHSASCDTHESVEPDEFDK